MNHCFDNSLPNFAKKLVAISLSSVYIGESNIDASCPFDPSGGINFFSFRSFSIKREIASRPWAVMLFVY